MKRSLVTLSLVCISLFSLAQTVPFPPWPSNPNVISDWGYTNAGTNWDTSPFLPFFYQAKHFRLMPPNGVVYNKAAHSFSNAVPGKLYPLIIFFNGRGEDGDDNNNQLHHGGQRHKNAILSGEFPGFALYPQQVTEVDARNILERILIEFPNLIDLNRIYVHGLSNGGIRSWLLAATYPTLIAAAFPMSAAGGEAQLQSLLYTPFRQAQGALDTNPSPAQSQMSVDWFNQNGGHLEYFLMPNTGHGTWDAQYARTDFFTWFLARKKNTIQVRFDKNLLCPGAPISVDMGFTPGFNGYEWRKDGVLISGQTGAKLIATTYGSYTGRINNRGVWSEWSDPVIVGTKPVTNTPPIQANGLKSVLLPSLDGSTTTDLTLPAGYASYVWKNASNQTVSTTQTYLNAPLGSYTATVTEVNGCTSTPSPVFNVVNATGPNAPDAVADFLGYATSVSQVTLAWTDKPSPNFNETGFEVYRALSPAGPFKLITIVPANGLGYIDSGLTPNTTYSYKVRPVNQYSAAPVTETISVLTQVDNIAPTTPGNLVATVPTPNSVTLTWTASTDNVGVFRYDVYRDNVKVLTVPTTPTSAVIYNLAAGETYNWTVKARDMTGNSSVASNIVTVPAALYGLAYSYYESATALGPHLPDFSTLTPIETGATPNIDLSIRNRDTNIAFKWTGMINIPVAGSYTFGTTSADGSKLYIGGEGEAFKVVDNDTGGGHTGSATAQATKTFATAGAYPIIATMFNTSGTPNMSIFWQNTASGQVAKVNIPNSAYNPTIAPEGLVPQPPQNLTATAAAFNQINLTWTDNSNNETGFKIYRSLSNTGPFIPVAQVPAGTTSYQDQTLAGNTKYYYRMTAVGDFGESQLSTQVPRGFTYSYYEAANMNSLTQLPTLVPKKTGNSLFLDIAIRERDQNMAIKWVGKINITTAGTYTFYVRNDDGSTLHIDGAQVVANDASQTQSNIEKSGSKVLTLGWHDIQIQWRKKTTTSNNFQVNWQRTTSPTMGKTQIGQNAGASTIFLGTEINATTPATPPPPAAPTNVVATNPVPTTIQVNWQDNSANETGFQILRSFQTNTNYVIYATVPVGTTSFQDPGLFANATYFYKVQAVGPGGSSTSGEVSGLTANNPPTLSTIQNTSVKFGQVLDVQVFSEDLDNDPITLSIVGTLPPFATFSDHTDGTGNLHFTPAANQLGDYTIVVKAADNHSGSTQTSFVLTVTDKDKPVILPFSNATLNEGTTGAINIQATSDFGAQNLVWSFVGLPSFASYNVNNGVCIVSLAPGYIHSGPYPVTVTVTDQLMTSTSKTFSITVNDIDPNKKFSVNMVGTAATAPWNNMTGITLNSLKDGNGVTTTTNVAFQIPANQFLTFNQGAVTGNNSGVFPDNVIRDYYYFGFNGGPNTASVRVTGLTPGLNYNFSFFGSSVWTGVPDNGSTLYTIGAQTVSLRVQNNTQNLAKLNSIAPAADGSVTFTMSKANGTTAGYLNAFTFESVYQDGTVPAPPRNVVATLAGSSVNVTWIDAPFNETGFDVYRATSETGPFTKINAAAVAKNATSYVDATIQDGATYYYELKAFNTYGQSAFSNVAQIVLPNLPPVITVTGDFSVAPDAFGMLSVSTATDATLTVTNLPSFAILSPVSASATDIILLPGASDAGTYNLLATAVDGQNQTTNRTITVTVAQQALYTVSVNFSNVSNGPAPWNNTAKQPALNDVFSNLKNGQNQTTPISLTLQTAFGGSYNEGAQTGNDSGMVPDAVLKEYYWFGAFGAANDIFMKVSGLSSANSYRFKFVASSVFTNGGTIAQNGSTVFSIGTKSATVNVQNNTSTFGVIDNVTTTNQGEVVIHLTKASGAAAGYINAMVIEAYPVDVSKFDPTNLVASGYSKTEVNLTWADNSPVETGYEIQRSETGADGTWGVINTTAAGVTSYIDPVPQSNKVYYYKVRANTAQGPSNFTNVSQAGVVSTKVYVHVGINNTVNYDAPAPWNNTSRFGFDGDIFYGFRDDAGQSTSLRLRVLTQLEGGNTWGANTGNNSGVFPDKVLQSFWFNDAYFPAGVFVIDGLDQSYSYNFGFLGSFVTSVAVNTEYSMNGQSTINRNDNNISSVSYLRNIKPDGNSEVQLTVKEVTGSNWSIWNALVIEGFPTGGTPSSGRMNTAARTDGNMKEIRYGIATNQMSFYPNPVESKMTVRIEDSSLGEVQYQFYDVMGHDMGRGTFNNDAINSEFEIGVDLPPALYLMKVTYPDGRSEVQKFVKN